MEGNIVVDGVLASCYASCHHDLNHIGALPIQLFPKIMEWIFGEEALSNLKLFEQLFIAFFQILIYFCHFKINVFRMY